MSTESKLGSVKDLEKLISELAKRRGSNKAKTIVVPGGTCGKARGSDKILKAVRESLAFPETAQKMAAVGLDAVRSHKTQRTKQECHTQANLSYICVNPSLLAIHCTPNSGRSKKT